MSKFWDSEEVFFDGDKYFENLINDLDQAKEYITVEMYMFSEDLLGKKIASHLIKAQKRGVKVQIVVDGIGSYGFFDQFYDAFNQEGVVVKMYNPLPFYHPYFGNLSFKRKLQIMGTRIWRMNRRNHRKIITIDHNILYAGSFNLTAEHTTYHSETPWKDMGMKVKGSNVRLAVLNFKKIWKLRDYFRYKKQMKEGFNISWKETPLRLNQTVYMKRYYYKNFLQNIKQAKTRVWFMTPYFIPKRRLIRVLGKAAQRGVDVRLLISLKTDVQFFRWLQYFYYAYLVKKGVKVYQYTETVLHAKNYIIDDFMTIGSSNLNHRSFMHDLEVDLVIQDDDNKRKVAEHFLTSVVSQNSITLEGLKQRPLWDRIMSRLIFLFKYWF